MFGKIAKNAITVSGIRDYAIIDNDEIRYSLDNGNIKIIGNINDDIIRELEL